MLLSGDFDTDALLGALGRVYKLDEINANRWPVTEKEKTRRR